jgi:hypothetical protein
MHHLDLTVQDLERSAPFYESVLAFMGYRRSKTGDGWIDRHPNRPDRHPSAVTFAGQLNLCSLLHTALSQTAHGRRRAQASRAREALQRGGQASAPGDVQSKHQRRQDDKSFSLLQGMVPRCRMPQLSSMAWSSRVHA